MSHINISSIQISVGNRINRLLIVILILGLLIRILFLYTSLNPIEADQATIGLMATHIMRGEYSFFYYGQSYGGPLEAYLTAPFIALFGMNRIVIRIIPLLFSLAGIYVTYLLGSHFFKERIGLLSALYAAIPPFLLLYRSLTADANYNMILVFGGLSLLQADIVIKHNSTRNVLLLVICLAIGLWIHPTILYYLLAIIIVLIARQGTITKKISSNPNLSMRAFITCSIILIGIIAWFFKSETYFWVVEYIQIFLQYTLPEIYGLLIPPYYGDLLLGEQYWNRGSLVHLIFTFVSVVPVLIVGVCAKNLFRDMQAIFPLFAISTIFLYLSSVMILHVNTDLLYTPRYLVPLYSLIPMGLYTIDQIFRNPKIIKAIVTIIIMVNFVGCMRAREPSTPDELLGWLMQRTGTQYIYADYWIGYWLAFETQEKVIPYSISGMNGVGHNRYPKYAHLVEQSAFPSYIYILNENNQIEFQTHLEKERIHFKSVILDNLIVYYELDQRVHFPLSNP